jgi:excinuclease UvrABC ATPase subunit
MNCPNCIGGFVYAAVPHADFIGVRCPVCNGTGKFPSDYLYLPKVGKLVKDSLIVRKLTLREAAKEYEIDVVELSLWKRGIFRKAGKGE